MTQSLTLKNETGKLIKTVSRESVLNLSGGEYSITDDIKSILSDLWNLSEYTGTLVLVVENG